MTDINNEAKHPAMMGQKEKYMPPFVEWVFVEVENGMAASDGGGSTDDMGIEDLQAD